MSTPERRDDDFLSALLDGAARLEDPIRMAAAVDELRSGAARAPAAPRDRVAGLCERELSDARAAGAAQPAPARRRPARRRRPVLVAAGLACVLAAGVVGAASMSPHGEQRASRAGAALSEAASTGPAFETVTAPGISGLALAPSVGRTAPAPPATT